MDNEEAKNQWAEMLYEEDKDELIDRIWDSMSTEQQQKVLDKMKEMDRD